MATVLTLHQGGTSAEGRAEATRAAMEALYELEPALPFNDPLKRAVGMLATALEGRVMTGRA